MKRLYLMLMVLAAGLFLVACNDEEDKKVDLAPEDNLEVEVQLDVAVNFGGNLFISYNQDSVYEGLDGKTYTKGDLTPTWAAIGENLNIKFNDKGMELAKPSTGVQFEDAKVDGFNGIDIINSTGASITTERERFVDLKPYIDAGRMPNLKKFIDSQPTYAPYLTAADGGMYYTPYLDGNEETELGFVMRIDWVESILDNDLEGDTTKAPGLANTTAFNPETLDIQMTVAAPDAKTKTVNKKYTKNVISVLKELGANATGDDYLQAFRTYMKAANPDYTKLSDVFVGTDASYITDELVALMAVIKANPKFVTRKHDAPLDDVAIYIPREARGSRVRGFFRGLEMYAVRGAVSKNNWLYLDADGDLHDSRHEETTKVALGRLNGLYADKLILQGFDNGGTNINHRDVLLKNANGFLMYDFNATQTVQDIIDSAKLIDEDYRFESVLPPAQDWHGDGTYFHFTESVRSLKNEAWGITKQAAKDPAKLARAITLLDYLYDAEEGADLHLFGPKEWRHATETVSYKGENIPKISDAAMNEMQTLEGGNMINYLRKYVGATMPVGHVRSLGVELQTLSEQGETGYYRVRNAVDAGTYKLIGVTPEAKDNPWYRSVPNVFALSTAQENELKQTKRAFDDYWADDRLYEIVQEGLSDNYDSLFQYEGEDWYADYIKYYQAALPKA